jgi:hypothetical protein
VDTLDAGTDNGFTFTSPNWPTEPQGVVYRLTHNYPNHPASSFFYPAIKKLPTMATFQFIKVRHDKNLLSCLPHNFSLLPRLSTSEPVGASAVSMPSTNNLQMKL